MDENFWVSNINYFLTALHTAKKPTV